MRAKLSETNTRVSPWTREFLLAATRPSLAALVGTLAVAATLHGLYDFVVILNPRNSLPIAALLIVAIWLWRLKLMRSLHDEASQDR